MKTRELKHPCKILFLLVVVVATREPIVAINGRCATVLSGLIHLHTLMQSVSLSEWRQKTTQTSQNDSALLSLAIFNKIWIAWQFRRICSLLLSPYIPICSHQRLNHSRSTKSTHSPEMILNLVLHRKNAAEKALAKLERGALFCSSVERDTMVSIRAFVNQFRATA